MRRGYSDLPEAEQGARANDHGCHASCSEQHGSRQPRSWLILNVRQRMKAKVIAIISGAIWTLIAAFILQSTINGRFTYLRWWACLIGPVIGLAVYYMSRWSYKKTRGIRILWAIVSLYLASGIYGW